MSRERVARFKASIKDPNIRKSVDNAINYRRTKQWPFDDILAFLIKEYGAYVPDYTSHCDGSSALQTDPLNSESDSESDNMTGEDDMLDSAPESQAFPSAVLNPSPEFQEREITDAEVAEMIERMRTLQVSHLHHYGEGVVIEMPSTKKPTEGAAEIQKAAEPASRADSGKNFLKEKRPLLNAVWKNLNSAEPKAEEKTAGTDPMRLASRPSPTRTVFSTVALLALIGFMSHYLISATAALYGTGVAVLLVLIPIAFVLFVKVPIVRYLALVLFLGADLYSVKALHEKEVARIATTTLDSHPEYQRLKKEYELSIAERGGINPSTHPSLRDKKATGLEKISTRMREIESTGMVTEQATADRTQADVTLGVRALLLIAAAIFAHALLHYSGGIDYDSWVRKAFGRDGKT